MKKLLMLLVSGLLFSQSAMAQDQGAFVGTNWFGSLYLNPKDDNAGGWLFAITPYGTPSGVSGCPIAREFFFRTNVPAANAMLASLIFPQHRWS